MINNQWQNDAIGEARTLINSGFMSLEEAKGVLL